MLSKHLGKDRIIACQGSGVAGYSTGAQLAFTGLQHDHRFAAPACRLDKSPALVFFKPFHIKGDYVGGDILREVIEQIKLANDRLVADADQLVDVQPWVERDSVPTDIYYPGLADLWVKDGARYGLPKDWDTVAVIYNAGTVGQLRVGRRTCALTRSCLRSTRFMSKAAVASI